MKISRNAFTLAEVLVTLAIIGVAASLTIPAVVKSTQEAQWKTAFKKEYSEIVQASMRLYQDLNNFAFINHEDMADNFKTYLQPAQDLFNTTDCWTSGFKFIDGTAYTGWAGGQSCHRLKNGMSVNYIRAAISFILVDVNGDQKQPNTFGKDIFFIHVHTDGVIKPYGGDPDTETGGNSYLAECIKAEGNFGWGCAAKVLKNEYY